MSSSKIKVQSAVHASSHENAILKTNADFEVRALMFWLATGTVSTAWTALGIAEGFVTGHGIEPTALLVRAGFVAFSALALAGTYMRKSLPSTLPAFYVLGILAVNSIALSNSDQITYLQSDFSALLFLAAGLIYRGSMVQWWILFAPAGLALVLLPVGVWETTQHLALGGILRAALGPSLAFIAGSLLASFQNLQDDASVHHSDVSQATDKVQKLRHQAAQVEADLRSLLTPPAPSVLPEAPAAVEEAAQQLPLISWETKEFTFNDPHAEQISHAEIPSVVMALSEVQLVLERAIEKTREQSVTQGLKGLRMTLTAPSDLSIPMAVRGAESDFQKLFENILKQSTASIGAGPGGTVRISLRPGTSVLSILVEDNGRGLSDSLLERTSPGQMDGWIQIRTFAHESGWKVDRQARLGVGSRTMIDLPRVDAFAAKPASSRRRSLISLGSSDQGSQHG